MNMWGRERGWRQPEEPYLVQQHPCGSFIVYSIHIFHTSEDVFFLKSQPCLNMTKDNLDSLKNNFPW